MSDIQSVILMNTLCGEFNGSQQHTG